MKTIFLTTIASFSLFVFGCELSGKTPVSAANDSPVNSAAPVNSAPNSAPLPESTPVKKAATKKVETAESLPRKIDEQTAVSPVYKINSKNCKNADDQASEGDDFYRDCKAYGNYILHASGSDYRVNYGITSNKPNGNFDVMLFPLETGDAAKYVRADQYDIKLGDKISWILDDKGKPFAISVRASFYKNTGSAKTFDNPKNKVAEFVLLRGLEGWKEIDTDIDAVDTAYNPDEWAKKVAYEILEKKQK